MYNRCRRPLERVFAAALLLALLACPHAEAKSSREPLYKETLRNGLKVVILENHRNPVASLNVFVKVGSMYEEDRINGISHFFEHLFFRGTATRTGEEFKREIESLGGQTNAKTTKDLTQFYINLPSQYAKQGLEILADALQHVRLQGSEIEQERKVVLDEYRIGLESPGAIIQELLCEMAYRQHPYRMPIIGTEKSIKGVSVQDLQDFRKRFYVPHRTVVIVVGDVTPHEIMPTIRELYGTFEGIDTAADTVPQEGGSGEIRERIERKDFQNAYVVLGFKAPTVRDRPDVYRVDLLTFLIGQGDGALLNQRLVEDKKIALNASCDFLTQRDAGLITMMATVTPARIEKVREAMIEIIREVRDGHVSQADFARAKNLLINTYLFGNETNSGKADGLGFYAAIDDVDFAQSYLDEVEKVTLPEVVAAARKYLDLTNYQVLVVRPADRRASADQ
jgi:zinc protease